MKAVKIYWKRFAAWVISLRDRYRQDLFYRTQWNIITLHVIMGITLLFLTTFTFHYLYQEVAQTVVIGVAEQIDSQGVVNSENIVQAVQDIKTKHLVFIFFGTAFAATLIGYFIAKVALAPARKGLILQKRFIGNIAHELRTPLSVVKANSEVLLMEETLEPKTRDLLRGNVEELNRASEIINNLLTLNNLIQPENPRFEDVDLGPIIDSSIAKLERYVEQQRIELRINKLSPRTVLGNKTALEQIFVNLLKNAISYTPPGGRVTVDVRPDYMGHILLIVEDTGIGIPQKDLFHIFEPFYRSATQPLKRRWKSSGLGLTIVSELLKLHSGKIVIRSVVNKGTTVIVMFPYKGESSSHLSAKPATNSNEVSMDFSYRHKSSSDKSSDSKDNS